MVHLGVGKVGKVEAEAEALALALGVVSVGPSARVVDGRKVPFVL
jgi:hypothetical protein